VEIGREDKTREKYLFIQAKSMDDPRAVEELFHKYHDLLRSFAGKYQSASLPFEDAYQVAALGLLKALERFDPERGAAFITFAYPTIAGELKKHYRDYIEVLRIPRRIRDLRRLILTAQENFRQKHRREPTTSEIAIYLDVPEENVIEALTTVRETHLLSLDMPLENEQGNDTLLSFLEHRDSALEHLETRVVLEQMMEPLPHLLRKILRMRLQGWTQKSIAKSLGISQVKVSRLQEKAIAKMNQSYAFQKEPA
jgi:RNA polymerase sigma-B factor